ncbi:alpha/beta-Hydrolases superfamily protein [Prunus dulcis]|uniref:Alpha/beta-Hydrolases superfamily protein n=1 Tax=Prunus dulcis TaxID=3755 RepID=A0A4Y1R6F8_PRUDU|nr:alpha/beta-Hydrolases superfamily protein [Prunus dulcis]
MEKIQHTNVQVRELKLHVAEIGSGPKVVLFFHGFPEIWYTWRHQMVAVANKGYRAIAFDHRGYGLSEQPAEPEKATLLDLVDDAVALLDSLGIDKLSYYVCVRTWFTENALLENTTASPLSQDHGSFLLAVYKNSKFNLDYLYQAFIVGKDFGALSAYRVGVLHPERVSAIITLGTPFIQPGPSVVQNHPLPEGFYISRWQGRAEADFGRFDVKTVIRNIYILFSKSEIPIAAADQEIMDLIDPATPLPPWFSEEDLSVYASLYEKSGFCFALQVPYRKLKVDRSLIDPKVSAPSLLIVGEKDYSLKMPGVNNYIRTGAMKHLVPDLDVKFIEEGTHFMHEQFPEQVNQLIIAFLGKHGA